MKQFIALMMLVTVLASCGEAAAPTPADTPTTETEINTEIDALTDTTTDDIDAELESLNDNTGAPAGVVEEITPPKPPTDTTTDDIDAELDVEYTEAEGVEPTEASTELESSVETVQVVYNNPKQEVNADIEYSLDSEGKITSIDITDFNYDITKHISDGNLDILIGKSLDEVEDTYIAGGSLTIPAVKQALSAAA